MQINRIKEMLQAQADVTLASNTQAEVASYILLEASNKGLAVISKLKSCGEWWETEPFDTVRKMKTQQAIADCCASVIDYFLTNNNNDVSMTLDVIETAEGVHTKSLLTDPKLSELSRVGKAELFAENLKHGHIDPALFNAMLDDFNVSRTQLYQLHILQCEIALFNLEHPDSKITITPEYQKIALYRTANEDYRTGLRQDILIAANAAL
jgi:hypothetical protein